MIKITLLISITLLFSACVNQHGISAKYYSDCEEYYDFQGFYHKDCGKDDIVTYSEIRDKAGNLVDSTKASATKAVNYLLGEEKKSNTDTNRQNTNTNTGSVW
ncbi:MAG: hypothetical protein NTZ60_07775 [Campylobacterales bacterium]|nr:hypothetical protein [Campylobacterales bacterium]